MIYCVAEISIQPVFSGNVQPGWDVELYRNGKLDRLHPRFGRMVEYLFEDVEIFFGKNNFKKLLPLAPKDRRGYWKMKWFRLAAECYLQENFEWRASATQREEKVITLEREDS